MSERPEQMEVSLREQQRAFVAQVFDGQPLAPELPCLRQTGVESFSAAQRFQLYHNNIFIGLREALSGTYPVIHRLVGDECFQYVARQYLYRHPPRSGNVHEFGAAFGEFLQAFPGLEDWAYLADVARLEWGYHRVFHAPEAAVLDLQKLSLLDAEEATERLHFQLASDCCVLSSAYPVLSIWQANQPDSEPVEVRLDQGGVQLVIRRLGPDVVFEPLNKAVFALLQCLSDGRRFADACAAALAVEPECDVGAILKGLIDRRLLSGFSCA